MRPEIASVDKLKELHEIFNGDVRNSFFTRVDITGEHEYSLAEHYKGINQIKISEDIPIDIAVQFETARNIYLYAWYVYRFYPVARHHVLACLELGLYKKLGDSIPKSYLPRPHVIPTMRPLLTYAIDIGLIKNEGFRQWHEEVQRRAENRYRDRQFSEMHELGLSGCELRFDNVVPDEQDRQFDFLSLLKKSLPDIRNAYAHGSTNLSNQALGTFEIVAEILEQLYAPER